LSLSFFTVEKVLVEEGAKVERGQPLCSLGPWDFERIPLRIEKILERNRSSHVGIFSMEDVSVDENNSFQMEGLAFKDVLRSYKKFSKFDIVVDHSDNFFSTESSAMNQLSLLKEWVDKIREEWRILAENLPETIFVRVYKDRMDLLRDVIIGPQGTPYHNGLCAFQATILIAHWYLVNYRSGGLGINPNLYKCGKVHLSLPKTSGVGQETIWAGNSTMLQLLVSIQGRILNTNPLYNDITYSLMKGFIYGEHSALYN
ncbi:ubiquitin-conjugating enzyme/RWD-like protein, partial [Tanacetum coccineum]